MAQRKNLHLDQGSDFRHTFLYREPDGETPIDLTGFTARAQVRESIWSATPLYEATTETAGLEISDPVAGKVVLTIAGSVSEAWLADQAVYDIEVVDASSKPSRIVQGTIYIDRESTR